MDVANEILDAIEIVADKKIREQTTQIYPGICKSVNGNSCVMSINGKDNTVQFYGSAPNVGAIYRVFVPYGNMSMAFIITTNGGGSSAFGVSSVNGLTGDVNLTAGDVGAAPAGYGLGGKYGVDITGSTGDANNAKYNGWYTTNSSTANLPTKMPYSACKEGTILTAVRGAQVKQTFFDNNYGYIATRLGNADTSVWGEWEYINPPMVLGVEYRTTERYKEKAVYKKLDTDGVIKWRVDGEDTWHFDKPIFKSVNLSSSGWASTAKTQTVTVSGVLADETKQLIIPTPALASQEAYYNAGIRCTGQSADKLTFTAKTIPTADLTVYVTIQEVGA